MVCRNPCGNAIRAKFIIEISYGIKLMDIFSWTIVSAMVRNVSDME